MKCSVHLGPIDSDLTSIANRLSPLLDALSVRLSRVYGGAMEHLWITLHLSPTLAAWHRPPPLSFRFQKRVSGRAAQSKFSATAVQDSYNVGHFGVQPNYDALLQLTPPSDLEYLLRVIYDATEVLEGKQTKLGGFDVQNFRADFAQAVRELNSEH